MAEEQKDHQKWLFDRGYVHLELGSYRTWVLKPWHDYFVRNKLITTNAYGQWSPYFKTISVFSEWLATYDKYMDAKDFNWTLPPEIAMKIQIAGLVQLK